MKRHRFSPYHIFLAVGLICLLATVSYSETLEAPTSSRREVIVDAATQALLERKPFIALRQLSLIGEDLADPAIQQMVEQSFQQIGENLTAVEEMTEQRSAIEDVAVQQLIDSAILSNPQLEENYVKILVARAISLSRIGYVPGLEVVYQQFKQRAPANSYLHDWLSFKIIDTAQGEVRDSFAPKLIFDLSQRGLIDSLDRLRFFMKGYYVGITGRNIILIIAVSFLIIGGYYWIFIFWRPHLLFKDAVIDTFSSPRVPTAEELLSDDDEYSRHLKILGLEDSASDAEIKQAYRLLIKELHPDGSNASKDPESLKRFREVQYAYKRIKEMNEGRFS